MTCARGGPALNHGPSLAPTLAAAAVFFYIDPLFLEDPAMDGVKSLTLSYTFFRTGEQEVMDVAHELAKRDDGKPADSASEKIRVWTAAVAKKTGVDAAGGGSVGSAGARAAGAGAAAQALTPISREAMRS